MDREKKMCLCFSAIFFCMLLPVAAQESHTITLQQAVDYALQHNKALLNAKDKVTVSQKKLKESIAQGLPQVEGSLDYMTYFNYELNIEFGPSGSSALAPPINYMLLDQGDYEVLKSIGQMFGSSEPIILDDQMSGKIGVSQLIFSKQYLTGIKMAKIARKLADQSVQLSELDVKENVTNTYYAIVVNEHTLKIIDANLANMNNVLQHTNNMYKAGIMEESDVDQIRIAVSQLKNTQKMLQRMQQLSYNMLKFQMGVAPDAHVVLADSLAQLLSIIDSPENLSRDFDITNTLSYRLMESQVLLSKQQLSLQRGAYTPTVVGFYNYTEKFITTAFDMNPNHLAGVSLKMPIFSSGVRSARVSQAKIELDIAQRNREMVKDQMEIQKKQLLYNVQNALENYITQKENVEIAGRVYKSIENKYRQGIASSLDLTQANTNLLTAESNYLSSVLTLLQAQTAIKKLYNEL